MREITTQAITDVVRAAAISANRILPEDVLKAFQDALPREESAVGKDILNQLMENARIAKEEGIPICQDTGLAILFVEMGQETSIVGGDFRNALEEGIRQGYRDGYLRKSACHPFTRKNTGDNTPVILHLDLVPGDKLKDLGGAQGRGQ